MKRYPEAERIAAMFTLFEHARLQLDLYAQDMMANGTLLEAFSAVMSARERLQSHPETVLEEAVKTLTEPVELDRHTLRQYMTDRGMTQKTLGTLVKWNPAYISLYLGGRRDMPKEIQTRVLNLINKGASHHDQ